MSDEFDQAWAAINALGGQSRADAYDLGFGAAIDAALEAIEELGGMSVAKRTIANVDVAAERDVEMVDAYLDFRRVQGEVW